MCVHDLQPYGLNGSYLISLLYHVRIYVESGKFHISVSVFSDRNYEILIIYSCILIQLTSFDIYVQYINIKMMRRG